MSRFLHPTKAQILRVHEAVLAKDGGASGIRDMSLLESALAAPQATIRGEPIMGEVGEAAAAYLYYLRGNHPFIDGNKRVAFAVCLVFLRLNGIAPRPDGPGWEQLVLDVAASKLNREQTTARLRELLG